MKKCEKCGQPVYSNGYVLYLNQNTFENIIKSLKVNEQVKHFVIDAIFNEIEQRKIKEQKW